jgi:hypothetical protein
VAGLLRHLHVRHGEYLAEVSSAPADEGYAEIAARLLERFLAEPPPHR